LALTLIKTNPFQDTPSDSYSHSLSAHQRALIAHFKQLTQRDWLQKKIKDMEGKCTVREFLRDNPIIEEFGDLVKVMERREERLKS
jgi:hypothetical protein